MEADLAGATPSWSPRSGRQADVLEAYRRAREVLVEQLTWRRSPSDHALEPTSALAQAKYRRDWTPICPRARVATERQNMPFGRAFL